MLTLEFIPTMIRTMIIVVLVWSPFAGAITAAVAYLTRRTSLKTKPLSIWEYAAIGAAYSMLLIFPWAYMLSRMLGKPFPDSIVRMAYAMLYFVFFSISTGLTMLLILNASIDFYKSRVFYFEIAYYALVGCVAFYAIIVSINRLMLMHSRRMMESSVEDSVLIRSIYLTPYVWGFAIFLGVIVALFVGSILFIYVAYRPEIYGYVILSFLTVSVITGLVLHQISRFWR